MGTIHPCIMYAHIQTQTYTITYPDGITYTPRVYDIRVLISDHIPSLPLALRENFIATWASRQQAKSNTWMFSANPSLGPLIVCRGTLGFKAANKFTGLVNQKTSRKQSIGTRKPQTYQKLQLTFWLGKY